MGRHPRGKQRGPWNGFPGLGAGGEDWCTEERPLQKRKIIVRRVGGGGNKRAFLFRGLFMFIALVPTRPVSRSSLKRERFDGEQHQKTGAGPRPVVFRGRALCFLPRLPSFRLFQSFPGAGDRGGGGWPGERLRRKVKAGWDGAGWGQISRGRGRFWVVGMEKTQKRGGFWPAKGAGGDWDGEPYETPPPLNTERPGSGGRKKRGVGGGVLGGFCWTHRRGWFLGWDPVCRV